MPSFKSFDFGNCSWTIEISFNLHVIEIPISNARPIYLSGVISEHITSVAVVHLFWKFDPLLTALQRSENTNK